MSPRLLTAKDVAERLSISRSKAFILLSSGTITAIRIGRNLRVEEQDLEKYISENKVSAVNIIPSFTRRNATKY